MTAIVEPQTRQLTTQEQRKRIHDAVRRMTPEQRARILSLSTPRIVEPYFAHIPHPKQQVFLGLRMQEAMYGGSAGGGKSDALLMAALQYADIPGYSALLLRRTWPDLASPGAILDRANTWLLGSPAHRRDGGRVWVFPSGARLTFGTIQYENDKFKYQSAEYQFVGFDELTQFDESQYTYMFSRIRRPQLVCLNCNKPVRKYELTFKHTNSANPCKQVFPDPKVLDQYPSAPDGTSIFDIPLRMRSATNPGGRGHEWVYNRFINPRTREKTSIFVPASLADNPSLDQESYTQNLMHLSPTDRERLLNGDWDVAEEGEMFERWWFKSVKEAPATRHVVRFWDNAASAGKGDYTVGAKLRLDDEGRWFIEDIVRGQWSSHEKQQVIRQTAVADGTGVPIRMEQEPGSSGVDVIDNYRRYVLVGYNFDGIRSTGSKEDRAGPAASAAEAGNVYMVEAQWNKKFLDEISAFPLGNNDDQVDAFSGAFNYLALSKRSRLLV